MLRRNVVKILFSLRKREFHQSVVIWTNNLEKHEISKIRNIGILAHIDAGKTTTTERMLFYSGTIGHMGEVHDGNTVTDFMDQERERGITICSAAVTFNWKGYHFNLIDTPGHIDFTMGVEQTLGVLDGVVIVLDGSAGVEAQTLTVWKQADRYNLPRLIYVNKMDRSDSDFEMCLKSIETKLNTIALPTQIPIKDKQGLSGIIDIITLEKVLFDSKRQGRLISKSKLYDLNDPHLLEAAKEKRRILTDKLSDIDDELANKVIEQDSLDDISDQCLVDSLRKSTINQKAVPVFLGSSYKNIGVQLLMDGIILNLPSPEMNSFANQYHYFNDNLSARVFKIIHDKQRGPITFFRVYTGTMTKNQKIYNIQQDKSEQSGRLYTAYADDYKDVDKIEKGNIGALTGLKSTITGDLLTSSGTVASRTKKAMEENKLAKPEDIERLFSVGTNVPEPVFFCSVEPPSMSAIKDLEKALEELKREDPSLRVIEDEETGQTILAGMGELHLEIIKHRIRNEYKVEADLGPLQIAYKETIQSPIMETHVLQCEYNKTKHEVSVTMSLIPSNNSKQMLLFDKTKESAANIASIHPKIMPLIKKGVMAGLLRGPKLGCPIINVVPKLHWFEIKRGTGEPVVSAAVSQCIQKILKASNSSLLEPVMSLEVVTLDEKFSQVMADLARRRTQITNIDVRGQNKVVYGTIPLSELLGYSKALRILSSGNASFSMEFSHYQSMSEYDEEKAKKSVTGF